jgi:hypothetical protein
LLPAADLLVAAGGFGLVAIDCGERPPRVPTAAWVRLQQIAEKQGTAVLLAAPWRMAGPVARAAIELRDARPRFLATGRPLLLGLEARVGISRGMAANGRWGADAAVCARAAADDAADAGPVRAEPEADVVRFWSRPA